MKAVHSNMDFTDGVLDELGKNRLPIQAALQPSAEDLLTLYRMHAKQLHLSFSLQHSP